MRSDERVVIKNRGKKKKRQNLGLCDELGWAMMMVTNLTASVLLPGAGSAMTPESQCMEVPTAKGRSVLRALSMSSGSRAVHGTLECGRR